MKYIIILALALAAGCSYTQYTTPNGGKLTNARAFWTTTELNVSIATNGTASLSTGSSKTDSEGIGMIVGAAIKAAKTP